MVDAALIFNWLGKWVGFSQIWRQMRRAALYGMLMLGPIMVGQMVFDQALIGQAHAAEKCNHPEFGVQNISIDQYAATANEARELGIRAAAETAFSVVLERVLNDVEKITAFRKDYDLDEFSDFVHIAKENSLDGRYIALLDFCFDAARLRSAFRSQGLKWTELRSPPILVLPVWQGPDGARAWQSDNSWLSGWREAVETAHGLLNLVLLEATILNERSLRAEDLAAANPVTLSYAAKLAKAEQTMLVIARLDYDGSSPILTVDGQLFSQNGDLITTLAKMVDVPVSGNLVDQLALARTQILQEMQTSWYVANAISGSETQRMTFTVPVKSLEEWTQRLSVFDQIAVFNGYKIRKLDLMSGVVTVNVEGTMAAVKNALSAHNLRVVMAADGGQSVVPMTVN